MKREIIGVITDIDDTLIPWEPPHAKAYPAMARALSEASGLPFETIRSKIQEVNTKHGTIEYTALIQEMFPLPSGLTDKKALKEARAQQHLLIEIARESSAKAKEGLIEPFRGIEILLQILHTNRLALVALSDAPKNLAYLRLKKAGLLPYFDMIIGSESPDDSKFAPAHRMEDKTFEVPTKTSEKKKPHAELDRLLGITATGIGKHYFFMGNSGFSDQGEAQKYGSLFYHTLWDTGTPEERAILLQYAPQVSLDDQNSNDPDSKVLIKPAFEKIEAKNTQILIDDLQRRKIIK